MRASRVQTILFSIFLLAVVTAVLLAVIAVFDPTGVIGVRTAARLEPITPRTPEAQACVNEYNNCAPSTVSYQQCVRDAAKKDEECRKLIQPNDPQRNEKLNQCAAITARRLLFCGELQCQPLSECDRALVQCLGQLPGGVVNPSTSATPLTSVSP